MFRRIQESLIAFWLANLGMGSGMALADWERPFSVSIPPGDIINVTPESADAATSLTWAARGFAIIAATTLLIMCAKRIHREDYYGAMLTFIGALIAGASPYLSSVLFLG